MIFIVSLSRAFHLEKIFVISGYDKISSQFSDQLYSTSYVSWLGCAKENIFSDFYLGICVLSRQKKIVCIHLF